MDLYEEDYRVVGTRESIIEFNHLLALINLCCQKRMNRRIILHVDGDGSAQLTIRRNHSREDMETYELKEKNPLVELDMTSMHKLILWSNKAFYGDNKENEETMRKENEEEYETLLKDIQLFENGYDIIARIGE